MLDADRTDMTTLFLVAPMEATTMAHPLRDGLVVNATVPLTAPAARVKRAGGCRSLLLDDRLTVAPTEDGDASVAVHVPELPGNTPVGVQVKVDRTAVPFDNKDTEEARVAPL